MTYYKELMRAYRYLDEKMKDRDKKEINEDALVYVITMNFAVPEKKIRQRIELLKEVSK